MKLAEYLKIERSLLLGLNSVPFQVRMMLSNNITSLIRGAESEDADTNGEEQELFENLRGILDEHQNT